VEIHERFIHEAVDGTRFLVVHGDLFDVVVVHARWLAYLGDWAYETALKINTLVAYARRRLGLPYWSLSAWAKRKVKTAVSFINDFETCLANEARREGADGVICGHIHHAAIRDIAGVRYINAGDWVESCTGIVEHHDGRFELIRFTDLVEAERRERPRLVAPLAKAG
jgi:UDP-2,3-diacylglucosamine pyrophosphatase LpxH